MNTLEGQIKFINELEKLKTIKRRNLTLDDKRPENSAEHSWHLAMMVPILSQYSKSEVDQLKVIKMLLIHDLGEMYIGDTWVYSKSNKDEIYGKELEAFKQLISTLPSIQQSELISLFIEFEAQESPEAKFAKVLDAIQPLINHLYVAEKNENPDDIQVNMVLKKKAFIKDYAPNLWSLVEEIIDRSVKKGLYRKQEAV